jgi:hypothetical protein
MPTIPGKCRTRERIRDSTTRIRTIMHEMAITVTIPTISTKRPTTTTTTTTTIQKYSHPRFPLKTPTSN